MDLGSDGEMDGSYGRGKGRGWYFFKRNICCVVSVGLKCVITPRMEDIWDWMCKRDYVSDVPHCKEVKIDCTNRGHVFQLQFFTDCETGLLRGEDSQPCFLTRNHHIGLVKFYPSWVVLCVDSERLASRQWIRIRRTFYRIETLDRLVDILKETQWGADVDVEEGVTSGAENDAALLCEVDRMAWGDPCI